MIINIHGLYGTAENVNYKILSKLYPVSEIYSPQIQFENRSPSSIMGELNAVKNIDFVVGNSLGGFFAYVLSAKRNCPCLLVNPCIPPTKYMKDPSFGYPEKFLDELKQLQESAEAIKIHQPVCNTFVILGKDDEVLDSRFTKSYLKNVELYEIEGGHRISGTAFKKQMKEITHKMERDMKLSSDYTDT